MSAEEAARKVQEKFGQKPSSHTLSAAAIGS